MQRHGENLQAFCTEIPAQPLEGVQLLTSIRCLLRILIKFEIRILDQKLFQNRYIEFSIPSHQDQG